MAFAGLGEKPALFKAAEQLEVKRSDELRQAYRLIIETTRFQNRLEYLISKELSEAVASHIPHGVRSLLKIIAYLRYVDRASESELERSVGLSRQVLGWKELHVYEKQVAVIAAGNLSLKHDALSELEKLSLDFCHSVWFTQRLLSVYGRGFAVQIMRRDMRPMPTYIRINSIKPQSKAWNTIELTRSRVEGVDGVFRLEKPGALSKLIQSGEGVIQDLASVTAGLVASPKPGQTVLDICAAPGNKTTHLAAQMNHQGQIFSVDISSKRLSHWKKEMVRCGCEIAASIRADARRLPLKTEADVVMVDPPCSNSGVFARNPSGKWKITPSRVTELVLRQHSILQAASEHVAPNGSVVYCTCSILPEEDELIVDAFLRKNPDFRLVRQIPFLGSPGLRGFEQCQRFYPHIHETNGYFIARLQREA